MTDFTQQNKYYQTQRVPFEFSRFLDSLNFEISLESSEYEHGFLNALKTLKNYFNSIEKYENARLMLPDYNVPA